MLVITVLCWVATMCFHNKFLENNEHQPHLMTLQDPLLDLFASRDASLVITVATWFNVGIVCLGIWNWDTQRLIHLQWMVICMMLMRTICVIVTPFRVRKDNIPIRDVFLDVLLKHVFGTNASFRNDLMFSGHLSHCLILAQAYPEWKDSLYVTGCAIALGMIASKTHYCIDLIVAVLVIPACVGFADFMCK
jgi:hypothetical protein